MKPMRVAKSHRAASAVLITLFSVVSASLESSPVRFVRADCNADGIFDITDSISLLDALYREDDDALTALELCESACDSNTDGSVDVSDVVFSLFSLFKEGFTPRPPFPDCGEAEDQWTTNCSLHTACNETPFSTIRFSLGEDTRVSLAVYDVDGIQVRELLRAVAYTSGDHEVEWDGLDGEGRLVDPGEYEWRLLETPGFTARFVTTLGVNPGSGAHGRFDENWAGDHLGAGTVAVDSTGMYVGAVLTEGLRQTLKQSLDGRTRFWQQSQYYDGGRATRVCADGDKVFLCQPNGRLRYLSPNTGRNRATWEIGWDGHPATDVDYYRGFLVAVFAGKGGVRWLNSDTGATVHGVEGITGVRNVTVVGSWNGGSILVEAEGTIYSLSRNFPTPVEVISGLGDCSGGIDIDHASGDLYVVERLDGDERVHRYDSKHQRVQSYGGVRRPHGPYDPTLFAGVFDVAADGNGGFYIAEPSGAPRRVARFSAKTGEILDEWYGGQSFYTHAAVDTEQPEFVWGCAHEGHVIQYRMDWGESSGDPVSWEIVATYATGNLGDALYPFTGKWRPFRKNGKTFLVLEGRAAILRVDEESHRVVPVAIASKAHSGNRTFSQFGGSGRDGYPIPWVAAADHYGRSNLATTPKYFYWGDADGDGEFDPEEFRIPNADPTEVGTHGGFNSNYDYVYASKLSTDRGFWRLRRTGWADEAEDVPIWDWDQVEPVGTFPEETRGFSHSREAISDEDGNVYGIIQAGVMIRGHGEYEGGSWPYQGIKKARIVKWRPDGVREFLVSRQTKTSSEVGIGKLYYPMKITLGPHGTIAVCDQVFQPNVVWTRDGLYAGTLWDHRADDGLSGDFYRTHSDDMQGIELAALDDGRVYWFNTVQGMQLVFETTGWDRLRRQTGVVSRPETARAPAREGKGLSATYYRERLGKEVAFRTVEAPIYFKPFSGSPHPNMPAPPHRIEWDGFLEAPNTDDYIFEVLKAADERIYVWIDGERFIWDLANTRVRVAKRLTAARRYRLRIVYENYVERPELKLLWWGTNMDKARVPVELLYEKPGE